jgi:carbon monoxide dehydrogenase subunit G
VLEVRFEKSPDRDDAGRDLDSAVQRQPLVLALKGATQVARDPDWVFTELHDPHTLLSCVPGGSLTRLVGPGRFEARIAIGAGPFKFTYSGTGRIVGSNPNSRTASMTLRGSATAAAPSIRIQMSMAVRPHPRGSEIQMSFRVVILDQTGLLARSWIDPIACEVLDHTVRLVKQRLEDTPLAPSPTAA